MKNFKILTLNDKIEWQEYLDKLNAPQKDIYYTPEFYSVYQKLGDGIAQCFVYKIDDKIALYPFLKNSINELGYKLADQYYDIQGSYGYNGVIYSHNDEQFISNFDNEFSIYCKENNIVAEFTRFHPILKNHQFSKSRLNIIKDRETVFLDLTNDLDAIWKKEYASKNRNMIRKAYNIGYSVEIIKNITVESIKKFIDIYHENMKNVNADKYYFFNEDYFINTFEDLKKHIYLFNVKNDIGTTMSSAIFFHYQNFFHYHLAGRSFNADNSTNNLLIHEAIRFAKKLGAKIIHLGGGRSSANDDSLLKFKKSFSKSYSEFSIGKKIHIPEIYSEIENQWYKTKNKSYEDYKHFLLKYRL